VNHTGGAIFRANPSGLGQGDFLRLADNGCQTDAMGNQQNSSAAVAAGNFIQCPRGSFGYLLQSFSAGCVRILRVCV
jgi:hypothetical protein